MTAGMGLRGDRLLRYVTAYCPNCHYEAPERPLADVARRCEVADQAAERPALRIRLGVDGQRAGVDGASGGDGGLCADGAGV